jgi:CheY-like chemotaxis protein/HPt (histidine-containing phosphotransfer) domain-containing protein
MGGEISVVSTLHQGSLFTLRVPLARVASADRAGALDARHDQQILEGLDCCVIGRPTVLTEDVAEYLRDAGATVRFSTATSARLDVEPSCWITDVEEPRSLEQVRDALRESFAAELCTNDRAPNSASAKFFVLTRGRRRTPRFLAPDVVELDADMATRASIVQAVAELTGRAARSEIDPNSASVTDDSNEIPAVVRADELKHGRLILVAEDDPTNREVMRQQLAMLGYAADIVDNGLVALELWRTGDYALVLADIQMPLMDGHELMQTIRREETYAGAKRTPIIAVTANAMDAEHIRCTASGADGFLTKPVLMDALKTKLTRWLPATGDHVREVIERVRPYAQRPTLARDNSTVVDAPIDAVISAPIDLTLLTQTFASAPHVLAELMSKFAQRGVSNAAEIESAVSEDRLDQARTVAHKLKGASGNFGARQLMNLCAALEHCDAATDQVEMRAMALQISAEMDRVNAHLTTHPLPHPAAE